MTDIINISKSHYNPYIVGNTIKDSKHFYGRDELLQQLLNNIENNHQAIEGERRIGKTSLLFQLAQKLREKKDRPVTFIPIEFILQGKTEQNFYSRLMKSIKREIQISYPHVDIKPHSDNRSTQYDDGDFEDDLEELLLTIQKKVGEFRLVFLWDEGDYLNEYPSLMQDSIRALIINRIYPINVIWAGVQIKETQADYGSPWYNLFKRIAINPLTEEEATSLITDPIKKLVYHFSEGAVQLILKYSENKPFTIQAICHQALANAITNQTKKITQQHIEQAIAEHEKARSITTQSLDVSTASHPLIHQVALGTINSSVPHSNRHKFRSDKNVEILSREFQHWLISSSEWGKKARWQDVKMYPRVGLKYDLVENSVTPLQISLLNAHLGIVGSSGSGKTSLLHTFVLSLASNYSPNHVHIYIMDLGGHKLNKLSKLPHVGGVIRSDEDWFLNKSEHLVHSINQIVLDRSKLFHEAKAPDFTRYTKERPNKLPLIVFVIDNYSLVNYGQNNEGDSLQRKLEVLIQKGITYGVKFVISVNEYEDFPSHLISFFSDRIALNLGNLKDYRLFLGEDIFEPTINKPGQGYAKLENKFFSIRAALPLAEDRLKGQGYVESIGINQISQNMVSVLQKMGGVNHPPLDFKLPDQNLSLPSLIFTIDEMAHLQGRSYQQKLANTISARWTRSLEQTFRDWPSIDIGQTWGLLPIAMPFNPMKNGAHLFILGGLGTGKTETIKTLALNLAIHYDPNLINFVLIDYGANDSLNELSRLPHCVDSIDYMQSENVSRVFDSIHSEIKRRKTINSKLGTKNILESHKKGQTQPIYPYLFVFIDELSELISEHPNVQNHLERLSRISGSVGIFFVITSRTLNGLSTRTQINIKNRLCFRLDDKQASLEALQSEKATLLPSTPGLGYFRTIASHIDLVQISNTAYATQHNITTNLIHETDPSVFTFFSKVLQEITLKQGRSKQNKPWADKLPTQFSLTTPIEINTIATPVSPQMDSPNQRALAPLSKSLVKWIDGENSWRKLLIWEDEAMSADIGIVENILAAQQFRLNINLSKGHLLVLGGSGSGKSTLLRTLLIQLMTDHSPNDLHIYLLDLGGNSLRGIDLFPHVGAIITPDGENYEERVSQLINQLQYIIIERRKLILGSQAHDLYEYNQANKQETLPAILIAIDNFIEFSATFRKQSRNAAYTTDVFDNFIKLVRQSRRYGIHFVITSDQLDSISRQLFNLFSQKLTLRLDKSSDYQSIVGTNMIDIQDTPGRGLIRIENTALPFQVAQLFDLAEQEIEDLSAESKLLEQIAQSMQTTCTVELNEISRPFGIDLPDILIPYQNFLPFSAKTTFWGQFRNFVLRNWESSVLPENSDWLTAKIGTGAGGKTRTLTFSAREDGTHGLVAGASGSGKTEFLKNLIIDLSINYSPEIFNFLLIDYNNESDGTRLSELPHCLEVASHTGLSSLQRLFLSIESELRRRQSVNTRTKIKDVVEYHQKDFHRHEWPDGSKPQAYPFLFIFVDGFSELITTHPSLIPHLETLSRTGRALGVSLILSVPNINKLSDSIFVNAKFRMCFRVDSTQESRDIVGRSDAAFLPNIPGRGYLKIGTSEIELLQIAYMGQPVLESEDIGYYVSAGLPLDISIAGTIQDIAEAHSYKNQLPPWPKPLSSGFPLTLPLFSQYHDSQTSRSPHLTLNHYFDSKDIEFIRMGDTWPNEDMDICLSLSTQLWLNRKNGWKKQSNFGWKKFGAKAIVGLIDNPYKNAQHLLIIDLQKSHWLILGTKGSGKTTFLRTLVTSLTTTHHPTWLNIYIFDLGERGLNEFESLPHVGSVINPDERGYEERIQYLLDEIETAIKERKQRFDTLNVNSLYEYNDQTTKESVLPSILLIIDNFAEFADSLLDLSGSNSPTIDSSRSYNQLIALIRQSKPYGIHFVITATRSDGLPQKVQTLFAEKLILQSGINGGHNSAQTTFTHKVTQIPGMGYINTQNPSPLQFQVAQVDFSIFRVGQTMQQMLLKTEGHNRNSLPLIIEALPNSILYTTIVRGEITENAFIRDLKQETAKKWQQARDPQNTDWLKAPIGTVSNSRTRSLHFSAREDGVHGIIAGSTGSGKSELLMTLITSLTLEYPPDILNFVLIDYKGGGAFQPFAKLPHCVDLVTNLNVNAGNRLFTAIRSELFRRQKMNVDTGTKDLIEYRCKGYHLREWPDGSPPQEYPHLLIIIDEYAEMIDDNPEYLRELETITRVGRAQGVMLILASQRPKGVTDQMRANIKLKICLRVEQTETSNELLRRPDAAYLPGGVPGRGYLQIGNENITPIQIAYTGNRLAVEDTTSFLEILFKSDFLAPTFFDAAVFIAQDLNKGNFVAKPWPPFLPNQLSLQTVFRHHQTNHSFVLSPPMNNWLTQSDKQKFWPGIHWPQQGLMATAGLIDDAAQARQYPLEIDLKQTHLGVWGGAGWGKTSFVQTLLLSMAVTHSPNEAHIYILDSSSHYRAFSSLPHVGAVISPYEEKFEERFQRILAFLESEVTKRQEIFSQNYVSHLFEFNALASQEILPAIIVVIDDFIELKTNYERIIEIELIPLLRRCSNSGISFIFTLPDLSSSSIQLRNLLTKRVTFQLSNEDHYLEIVGRGAKPLDQLPGRGYIRINQHPRLFQAATPFAEQPVDEPNKNKQNTIQSLAEQMNLDVSTRFNWFNKPINIKVLSEFIPLRPIISAEYNQLRHQIHATVGFNQHHKPVHINFQSEPGFAITGSSGSGKTTLLHDIILSLAVNNSPQHARMVLIDIRHQLFDYGGDHSLSELPHVLETISDLDQIQSLYQLIDSEYSRPLKDGEEIKHLFIIIDNIDDLFDEAGLSGRDSQNALNMLAIALRRYGTYGLHVIASGDLSNKSMLLWRRILSFRFGVALQSSRSLSAQRVNSIPRQVRGERELPAGRGFLIKSGQTTLLQVATPYSDSTRPSPTLSIMELEHKVAQHLDSWVEQINNLYTSEHTIAVSFHNEAKLQSLSVRKQNRRKGLLQRLLQQKLNQTQINSQSILKIIKQIMNDEYVLQDESFVIQSLRTIWVIQQEELHSTVIIPLELMDDDSIVLELETNM